MSTALEALSNDLAATAELTSASVVAIHARRRIPSSGVIWRDDLVVAANHTVHKEEDVRIGLAGGRTTSASVAGRDPSTDLCVLRLAAGVDDAAGETPSLPRAEARVGELALAVGRPGADVTASFGAISAVGPEWRTWRGGKVDRFVRLDLAVYDGFSGAAVVSAVGALVGIGTSGLSRAAALAIPVSTVDRVVDAILAGGGRSGRGYLGIGTQPVRIPESVRGRLAPIGGEMPHVGLLVVAVQPDAPADRAGMMLGDLLVALGGEPVADPRDVLGALGPDAIGRPLSATIVRAGAPITLEITVGEHPRGA